MRRASSRSVDSQGRSGDSQGVFMRSINIAGPARRLMRRAGMSPQASPRHRQEIDGNADVDEMLVQDAEMKSIAPHENSKLMRRAGMSNLGSNGDSKPRKKKSPRSGPRHRQEINDDADIGE